MTGFKKKIACTLLGAGLMATVTAAPAQAVLVGWNYINPGTGDVGVAEILPAEVAGAPGFEQSNWNNHAGVGQGPADPGSLPFALVNNSGAPSSVAVTSWTQTLNNSWHLGDHDSPNAKLLDGFANQQAAITFDGLGTQFAGGYAVVVYYSNNEGPTTSTLTLTGGLDDLVSRDIRTGDTAQTSYSNVGFIQGTDANSAAVTNYTVFTGLNDASFTVAMTGGGNNGIAGVQIVSNDELPPPPRLATRSAGSGSRSATAACSRPTRWPDSQATRRPTGTPKAASVSTPAAA